MVEPAGSFDAAGIATSRLRPPPEDAQPKSLPEPENQARLALAPSPVAKTDLSSRVRPGSLATYISELCTMPSRPFFSVYFLPDFVRQWMTPVSSLESFHFFTVFLRLGLRTSGTTQPSSWRLKPSMFWLLSVAMRFQSP